MGNESELLEKRNKPEDFLSNFHRASLLHISGHFLESEVHPFYNKIHIGNKNGKPMFFSPVDIMGKKISSSVVILNACNSNQNVVYDSFTGLRSLPMYLLEGGASSILATSIDIDDFTSVKLIEKFYEHLFNGIDAVESLRLAKEYIYKNYSQSPKYWATTQIFGDNFYVKPSRRYTFYITMMIILLSFSGFLVLQKKRRLGSKSQP